MTPRTKRTAIKPKRSFNRLLLDFLRFFFFATLCFPVASGRFAGFWFSVPVTRYPSGRLWLSLRRLAIRTPSFAAIVLFSIPYLRRIHGKNMKSFFNFQVFWECCAGGNACRLFYRTPSRMSVSACRLFWGSRVERTASLCYYIRGNPLALQANLSFTF